MRCIEPLLTPVFADPQDFYAHLGWPAFPTLEAVLPPVAPSSASRTAFAPTTTPLTAADLPALCEQDTAALVASVRETPLAPGTFARVLFLPTYAQAAWHFGAEEFIAASIFPPSHAPSVAVEFKGAMGASGRVWAYWVHDFSDDKLTLLRTGLPRRVEHGGEGADGEVAEREATEELADVLRAAQAEAGRWGLAKVTMWNPDERTREACAKVLGLALGKEVEIRERLEGSIPCLRWKGGKGPGDAETIEWVALEKYTWC